jgi:hypothetical protein
MQRGNSNPLGWTKNMAYGTPPDVRAKERASFLHPVFTQPADRSMQIWRYMDLPKFVHVLAFSSLYFPRVDLMGDPWEGALPAGSLNHFDALEKALPTVGGPEMTWRALWLKGHERMSKSMFISCWQGQECESDMLWIKYAGKPFGVAIRSTYERLDSALPLAFESQEVMLGLVKYGNYQSTEYALDLNNAFNFFMSKRQEHRGDNEVRAILSNFGADDQRMGYNVTVLLPTLVEAVVTAPGAPGWFRDLVKHLCVRFGLDNVRVESSTLDLDPVARV